MKTLYDWLVGGEPHANGFGEAHAAAMLLLHYVRILSGPRSPETDAELVRVVDSLSDTLPRFISTMRRPTRVELANMLHERLNLPDEELEHIQDVFLLPAPDLDALRIALRRLDALAEKLPDWALPQVASSGRTLRRVVILASSPSLLGDLDRAVEKRFELGAGVPLGDLPEPPVGGSAVDRIVESFRLRTASMRAAWQDRVADWSDGFSAALRRPGTGNEVLSSVGLTLLREAGVDVIHPVEEATLDCLRAWRDGMKASVLVRLAMVADRFVQVAVRTRGGPLHDQFVGATFVPSFASVICREVNKKKYGNGRLPAVIVENERHLSHVGELVARKQTFEGADQELLKIVFGEVPNLAEAMNAALIGVAEVCDAAVSLRIDRLPVFVPVMRTVSANLLDWSAPPS